MKQILLLAGVFFCLSLNAQIVTIPDPNFKAALLNNSLLNTNMDTEIQVSEAAIYNNQLQLSNLSINDLTGIEAFTSMTSLFCPGNNLTTLDVSACNALISLTCYNNQLSSLTINNSMTDLLASNNQLGSIDLSQNSSLTNIYLDNNSISGSVDVSHCTNLTNFNIANNQISGLNIANGNNTNMFNMLASGNSSLTCITVDNAFWSGLAWSSSVDAQTEFSEDCNGGIICTVLIPDANFKAYLVGNSLINTNLDTEIQCDEAEAFTGALDCSNLNISDLSGIEAFTHIVGLNCQLNNLTNLNIAYNTELVSLNCQYNNLPDLTTFYNPDLISLECSANSINGLYLANNPNLITLHCADNQITSLDLSWTPNLEVLFCASNLLSTLDVSYNPSLVYLNFQANNISSINTSNLPNLEELICASNNLVDVDVSANSNLTNFSGDANQLTTLNVQNGNNTNFTYFSAVSNPNLSCIEVDDAVWSTSNWTSIDATASYNENCGSPASLENLTESIQIYPNPTESLIHVESSSTISNLMLLSLNGETLLQTSSNPIDLSAFESGIYILHIESETGLIQKRISKI